MDFKLKESHIAVVGDIMIDAYIWGSSNRVSPEAPVVVVNSKEQTFRLGGAGNVARNLKALNAKVSLFSVIGDDENAKILKSLIKDFNSNLVEEKGRVTTKKLRIMASKQQVLRVDEEITKTILQETQDKILKDIQNSIDSFDAIVISDYAKGVVTKELSQKIIKLAKRNSIPILIDPKGSDYSKYRGATLITPNKKEAIIATNIDIKDKKSIYKAIKKLKDELELEYGLITLSEDGIAILDDEFFIVPTVAKEVYDVTGAGDTVLSAIAIAFANGFDIKSAAMFANSAAAVVVAKVGSATATIDEILEYNRVLNLSDIESKIVSKEVAKIIIEQKRANGKRVVFTNGCFDILHKGHAYYLNEAKKLGDLLVVGLNSNSSVKRLKGDSRPVNDQEDRAYLLSALSSVDLVVIFDEDTPYNLIKELKPDILVKGADYKDKEVVGSNLVKEVKLIDFVEGKSTTNIINKMRSS
jgi:D-beta-D-heptose 7-phosphate kinase/D-beta-D-heptose 1-phosphate adenosyltransferase